jgi:hypothetical protein
MAYIPPRLHPLVSIQRGYSSIILALYSALQAGLLVLMVRTAAKGTLTSCS